jgi:hypothetical protein
MLNFGQGLWVYLQNEDKYRWVGLALAIFCALIFPEVIGLAVFHCYISFFLYKTTL